MTRDEVHRMFKLKLSLAVGLMICGVVQAAEPLTIDVHRDANCGCCKDWVKHLESNGFKVVDHVESNMSAIKQNLGVPQGLASCHTAVIDGKFVEGHVPADEIKKLNGRSDLAGIASARHARRFSWYGLRPESSTLPSPGAHQGRCARSGRWLPHQPIVVAQI